ncbi:MAG: ABC transporter ATP-binding protein [Chloroflexi bacterium]|nr:MAG: ABC transporter ATP-binding protein [Chloroflexota bacterium]
MTQTSPPPAVEMRGIVKRFPGVIANDHVDLTVYPGEIHALLGENGAGKSTLMSVLAGMYRPDEGEIYLTPRGETQPRLVDIHSPRDAINLGIGMVHQHFMLVPPQTVAENIIIGLDEPRFFLNMSRVEEKVRQISEHYRLHVDPEAYIWQLSVGEQQRVEILKLLYRGADILILDEPTAVLTPQESDELGQTLRRMVAEGKSVIFITHKLDEVTKFADRVTVLRDGKNVATLPIAETNKTELARLMVGREVLFRLDKAQVDPGPVVLSLRNLEALNDKGLPALRGISLDIHSGEIVGIAGVAGNGQRELSEVVTGLRKATAGQVLVRDQEMTNCSPREFIQAGVSHIPGDRLGMGLAGNLPVSDNLIMKAYRGAPISSGPFLRFQPIRDFSRRLVKAFQIFTPGLGVPARLLSGGNQQKAILAREITAGDEMAGGEAAALIAVHPTRGLDVGATEAVRRTLLEQRSKGMAILLISEDLDELIALSDRIAVIYEGQIMGIVPADQADIAELGLMMAGEKKLAD